MPDKPFELGPDEKVTPEKMYAAIKLTRDTLHDTAEKLESVESKGDHTRWGVIGVGFLVLLVAVVLLWREAESSSQQNEEFIEFAYCQAEYNRINALTSNVRVKLNAEEDKNTRELITKIGQLVNSDEGNLPSFFERYKKELARIDKLRAENPPIAYPDCYNKYIEAKGTTSTLPTAARR